MARPLLRTPGGRVYPVLNRGVKRGSPFGDEPWEEQMARELDLEAMLRPWADRGKWVYHGSIEP